MPRKSYMTDSGLTQYQAETIIGLVATAKFNAGGTGQSDATLLCSDVVFVRTVSGSAGCILPPSSNTGANYDVVTPEGVKLSSGDTYVVLNATTSTIYVYPISGKNFIGQAANAPVPILGGAVGRFIYADADVWQADVSTVLVDGLQVKATATWATTAALPANIYANGASGAGATLTGAVVGALSVDGGTLAIGDVVLVKDEVAQANRGLYTVTATGSGIAVYVLTRHVDMNTAAEFSGAFVPVGNGGTANANSLWLANPTTPVTVGTTAIPFTQLNGATDLIAGSNITISGNTIAVSTSPSFTTPNINVATATSVNKVAITAPATAATLAFGTDNATITFQGTDTYVGRATTDTLTNKTLTSPTLNNVVTRGTYTWSGKPAAGAAGQKIFISDSTYGIYQEFVSDGTRWKPSGGSVTWCDSTIKCYAPSDGTNTKINATGTSGQLLLGTALDATYSQGLWMYLPANSNCAPTQSAGWFWVVMSSSTVGTVYSGAPGSSAINFTGTGNYAAAATSSFQNCTALPNVAPATGTTTGLTIPGTLMGPNGRLEFDADFRANNTGGSKNYRTYWDVTGAHTMFTAALTTGVEDNTKSKFINAGATNAQTIIPGRNYGSTTGSMSVGALDTTADFIVDAQINIGTNTDWIMVLSQRITVWTS